MSCSISLRSGNKAMGRSHHLVEGTRLPWLCSMPCCRSVRLKPYSAVNNNGTILREDILTPTISLWGEALTQKQFISTHATYIKQTPNPPPPSNEKRERWDIPELVRNSTTRQNDQQYPSNRGTRKM
ncbi:hypothetical protein CDAR_1191 [Caerostris darwini]|uniref:Uncharacterized protein n=1 Tax=Caerostris darwini TaxID=1538125 RepID=A0AAV4SNI1_9ARAC|nr:hypothetical protein CDAR_1001 [Caerostris darwini]GIY35320.1 hypothetical protein CDAR_1191 [Caerostris darwini]